MDRNGVRGEKVFFTVSGVRVQEDRFAIDHKKIAKRSLAAVCVQEQSSESGERMERLFL